MNTLITLTYIFNVFKMCNTHACLCVTGPGWKAEIRPSDHPVAEFDFDVVIGADGRRNTLEGILASKRFSFLQRTPYKSLEAAYINLYYSKHTHGILHVYIVTK